MSCARAFNVLPTSFYLEQIFLYRPLVGGEITGDTQSCCISDWLPTAFWRVVSQVYNDYTPA